MARDVRNPNEDARLPQIETARSARGQRGCWQQACGIVGSWVANARTHPPILKRIRIPGHANVIKLEESQSPAFDSGLRVRTREQGKPVYLPGKLPHDAKETIEEWDQLSSSVRLNNPGQRGYATFVVEKPGAQEKKIERVVGGDLGIQSTLAPSDGQEIGQFSQKLNQKREGEPEPFRRKQNLNACLRAKELPEVESGNRKGEAFTRNELNRALNQWIEELAGEPGVAVAKERWSVAERRFKSRERNRLLRAAPLG